MLTIRHYKYVLKALSLKGSLHSIRFDVVYYVQKETESITYLMYNDPERPLADGLYSVVELTASKIDALETVEFFGKNVNIPKNSEAYLAERYGENWRIPDKNYVYWKGPSTRPTDFTAKQKI